MKETKAIPVKPSSDPGLIALACRVDASLGQVEAATSIEDTDIVSAPIDMVEKISSQAHSGGNGASTVHRLNAVATAGCQALGIALLGVALFGWPLQSGAADVVVKVSGIVKPSGEIGCSLFASAPGFPMDISKARSIWLAADVQGVTCRFENVADGVYAISVGQDLNGNRKIDTNFLGIPKEPWGVTNSVRPALRAPRFDEASFKVVGSREVVVDVGVAK